MKTRLHRFLTLLTALLALTGTPAAHADIIRGRVVDAETKEPLAEASVRLILSNDHGTTTWYKTTDSTGVFMAHAQGRLTIEASMLGYYTRSKPVLAFTDSKKDTIDVGDIGLKMSPQMLKMVEVKGRARRFTVRGDTIVFHPEAFHLEDGARLDELIRQLPGVEVGDDGKMTWNGKPIRLTMDGENLFGGNDLVRQLPAEAVQEIKAYNKASDLAKRTGRNDGEEDMVLDLSIKPGFLDRWYGNAEATYQAPKYYEAGLSMNRLSKTDPMMVFATVNNIDARHRASMHYRSWVGGNQFGEEQNGAAAWQHNWVRKQGGKELNSYYTFNGGLLHDNHWGTEYTETETYFPNTAASRQHADYYSSNQALSPTFSAELLWRADTLNNLSLNVSSTYRDTRDTNRETTEQEEEYVGSGYAPTISQLVDAHSKGHWLELRSEGEWWYNLKEGELGAKLSISHSNGDNDSWTDRTITDHRNAANSQALSQQSSSPSATLDVEASARYKLWLTPRWMMNMTYRMNHHRNHSQQDFSVGGVADDANSYDNRYHHNNHTAEVSSTINMGTAQLMPRLTGRWLREHQDYRRGLLDTAAVRHRFVADPSVKATWRLTKTMSMEANYGFTTRQPRLLQTIGFRDMTNPLYIEEGNPDLLDSHTSNWSLSYNLVLARQQASLSATASYRTTDHSTVNALTYNPATAVYTTRPESVKGDQTWEVRVNYDQGLGEHFRLKSDLRLNGGQAYGYLTLLPTQTERTLNKQSRLQPKVGLSLMYDKDWLKMQVFTHNDANRLRFSASPEQNTTLWLNEFGIDLTATAGKLTFKSVIREELRHGYTAQSMNRNRLYWDASVTYKILKNKGYLKLSFDDLFNNRDGFSSEQSAYQQTFTWRDYRHYYVGLTFFYHLDAKKKD